METYRSRFTGANHPGIGYGPPCIHSIALSYGYSLTFSDYARYEWENNDQDKLVWSKKDLYTAYMLTHASFGCKLSHVTLSELDKFLYERQKLFM